MTGNKESYSDLSFFYICWFHTQQLFLTENYAFGNPQSSMPKDTVCSACLSPPCSRGSDSCGNPLGNNNKANYWPLREEQAHCGSPRGHTSLQRAPWTSISAWGREYTWECLLVLRQRLQSRLPMCIHGPNTGIPAKPGKKRGFPFSTQC